ncbi:WbqC family protein [Rufibacter glacialis]|uniref:WbqC family protein n=1 Tax=Rufibacter glacialis TaxID=1259555 RepID=A0A5M8QSI1_9BACT|nr:WbqC family protein [Rufibacter glacialis]KAA6437606.1 WbqC family protein [Rufibacter glacialis]GGK57882.1 hypothetical protein GCM10011405_02450 [Rufibacter glacialis]
MSTVAIMQPYVLPYIGYFQLIAAVDKFIVYDDVNFIKSGWINRNNILVNNNPYLFTIPLENASSFQLIKDTKVNIKLYLIWKDKFYRTVSQSYKKAPFFDEVNPLICSIFDNVTCDISNLAVNSLKEVCKYLKINTSILETSQGYLNAHMKGQERVIDICMQEGAANYINPIGGLQLYSKEYFEKQKIKLSFIKPTAIEYKQFKGEFVPWLSIIDVLMFNSKEQVNVLINNYELL